MSPKLRQEYEAYRLQWLIDHGYTLTDLLNAIEEYSKEVIQPDSLDDLMEYWAAECGFAGSEIWVSFNEWVDNEYQEELEGEKCD